MQIPFISSESINCNQITPAHMQECLQILDSDLSFDEKSLLISNLDYTNKMRPDHSYVYHKNVNLEINSPPEGVSKQNSNYIKNAWVDIFSAMPSVLYNGTLYVPNQTTILTGYNYEVQTPPDYYSPRYPKTSNGDCKRTYSLVENTAENKVYVNQIYHGDGKLVNLQIDSNSVIKSEYQIRVSVNVKHYRWMEEDHDQRCKYVYSETYSDQIQISDELNVSYYNQTLFADIDVLNQHQDTTKIYPNFSNSLELKFENSAYNFHEFVYSINYTKPPYYVYTIRAEDYRQESFSNIQKDGENILVNNVDKCHFRAFNFFETLNKDCLIFGDNFSLLIKTDKLKYKENETIFVSIFPNNVSVQLIYANQTKNAISNATFAAQSQANKITAKYHDYSAEKVIFLVNRSRLELYWDLSVFGLLNYFVYSVLKRGIWRFI